MHDPRRAAVSALRAWADGHDYAETLVERQAGRQRLSGPDRALLQAIVFGVLRNRRLLDHWIASLRKGQLDHLTRDILRVGLCQLLILELPDHAAVFETVELGKSAVRGLINAVLRRAAATRKRLREELDSLPPAVRYSHPDWLAKRWRLAHGADAAVALMDWNNRPAQVFARLNPLVSPPPESNLPPADPELPPGFLHLEGPPPREWLECGALYIQDPATRHCVELLDARPGEAVLDACAAPGGKAFLIAAARGTAAGLTCTDSNDKRLPRLRDNLARLCCGDAAVELHDWTTPAPGRWHDAFDAILLDVPCSNTGVMRRRVDVRWRLQARDITTLATTQREILGHALPCLKPGGRLVYSTCSLEPEENEQQVEALLAAHPSLRLIATRQALPHRDQTDGAFAALLRAE
jgi:16S rRNA (cytosine967-C5)-methyltransferase